MAEPTRYVVSYSFAGFQATSPNAPLPAPRVDDELHNISESIGSLVAAVMDVRREDGALRNGVVTLDTLAPEVGARLGVAYDNAYDVAVAEGFTGTVGEWLATLAANVTVGSVMASAPGSPAEVVVTGTPPNAVLNFTIPRGVPGPSGDGSGDMVRSVYDTQSVNADAFDMVNMRESANAKVLTAGERTLIGTISGKLDVTDVASSADVRASTAAKVLDTTGVWNAAGFATLGDASTIPVNMATFLNAQVTITANRILGAPSNAKPGQSGCIKVTASGATRTIGKHSSYKSATPFPVSIPNGASVYLFYFVVTAGEVVLSVVDGVS